MNGGQCKPAKLGKGEEGNGQMTRLEWKDGALERRMDTAECCRALGLASTPETAWPSVGTKRPGAALYGHAGRVSDGRSRKHLYELSFRTYCRVQQVAKRTYLQDLLPWRRPRTHRKSNNGREPTGRDGGGVPECPFVFMRTEEVELGLECLTLTLKLKEIYTTKAVWRSRARIRTPPPPLSQSLTTVSYLARPSSGSRSSYLPTHATLARRTHTKR